MDWASWNMCRQRVLPIQMCSGGEANHIQILDLHSLRERFAQNDLTWSTRQCPERRGYAASARKSKAVEGIQEILQ
eukprot:915932-Karenia_brevis.AAC.1